MEFRSNTRLQSHQCRTEMEDLFAKVIETNPCLSSIVLCDREGVILFQQGHQVFDHSAIPLLLDMKSHLGKPNHLIGNYKQGILVQFYIGSLVLSLLSNSTQNMGLIQVIGKAMSSQVEQIATLISNQS